MTIRLRLAVTPFAIGASQKEANRSFATQETSCYSGKHQRLSTCHLPQDPHPPGRGPKAGRPSAGSSSRTAKSGRSVSPYRAAPPARAGSGIPRCRRSPWAKSSSPAPARRRRGNPAARAPAPSSGRRPVPRHRRARLLPRSVRAVQNRSGPHHGRSGHHETGRLDVIDPLPRSPRGGRRRARERPRTARRTAATVTSRPTTARRDRPSGGTAITTT